MRLLLSALVVATLMALPRAVPAESAPGAATIVKVEVEGQLLESRERLLQVLSVEVSPGRLFVPDRGVCPLPSEVSCSEADAAAGAPAPRTSPGPGADAPRASGLQPTSHPASQPASGPSSRPASSGPALRDARGGAQRRATPPGSPTRRARAARRAVGTRCRVAILLANLYYQSKVDVTRVPGGVALRIRVEPQRLIRKVYVTGNWPLFEEEILRLIRFRPSQPLPEACAMAEEVATAERRIKDFLARQGYFDGDVKFVTWPSRGKYQVDLLIRLKLGRRYKVDGVRAEGNLALTEPDIARAFHHSAWYTLGLTEEPFTTKQLRDDLEAITRRYRKLGYPAARVRSDFSLKESIDRKSGVVRLGINVHEGRQVEVLFLGNLKVSDSDLKEALTFDASGSYDQFEVEESARRLRDLYQAKGYFRAQVTGRRRRGGDQRLLVTFNVVEGPQLKVRRVAFTGNRRFTDDTLRDVVQTRVYPWLGRVGLGQGGFITDTQLKQDIERLVTFYRAQGFARVKVAGEVAPLDTDPSALAVRFTVEEGPQVTIRKVQVEFHGPHRLSEREVLRDLTLRPGAPYTTTGLKLDGALILRRYASAGHPHVEINQASSVVAHQRDILWIINEGPLVHVGEILIRGNFKTRRHVILNEIPLSTGDRFDLAKAELAERNLRTLGLFRGVRLTWIGLKDRNRDVAHLMVHVQERYDHLASMEVGVGFSTDTVAGTAMFTNATASQGNVLGMGYNLSLLTEFTYSFTLGTWSRHIRGTFINPRLLGRRVKLEHNAYWRVEDTIRLGRLETYGTTLSLSREILPGLSGALRYDLKRVLRNETLVRPPGPLEDIERVQIPTDIGSAGVALVFDRRDHPLAPTRGYRLALGSQWASRYLGPAAYAQGEDFIKVHAGAQGFIPLGRDLVLVQSIRYDQGFPLGGASLLPKIERFYAGGDTTVRGFEQDRMWTELVRQSIPPLPADAAFRVSPQGGNIRVIHNFELVFPIWRKSIVFGMPIHGALLFDTGLLTNSFDAFSIRDIRHSAGVAFVRLVTPVGALSFEFATPLNPRPGDIKPGDTWRSWPWNWPGRLHFNFGFVF